MEQSSKDHPEDIEGKTRTELGGEDARVRDRINEIETSTRGSWTDLNASGSSTQTELNKQGERKR